MKQWLITCVLALGMASQAEDATSAYASNSWKFSVGLTHRTLGDLSVDAESFVNPDFGGDYVDGAYDQSARIIEVSDVDSQVVDVAGTYYITLDQATFAGVEDDMDSGMGLVLAMEKPFAQQNGLLFSWHCSLMALTAEQDIEQAASVSASSFTASLKAGNTYFNTIESADSSTVTPVATGNVAVSADVSLFTFGAGVKSSWVKDAFAVSLSAGPTLNVTSFDVEKTLTTTGSVEMSDKETEVGLDAKLGAYIGLDLSYKFNDSMAVGFEYRYDHAFGDVDMEFAEQELSGLSASLKLTIDL
jgi:hypothetical protein